MECCLVLLCAKCSCCKSGHIHFVKAAQAFSGPDQQPKAWPQSTISKLVRVALNQCITLQDGIISLQSACRYLRLPAGLHSHKPFAQLVQRATSRVRAEFDDLDAVWLNEDLQTSFLKLPLPALLVLSSAPNDKHIQSTCSYVSTFVDLTHA